MIATIFNRAECRASTFGGIVLSLTIGTLPAACALYTPQPLPHEPPLVPRFAALPGTAEFAGRALSVDEVVALALQNSPELRAARARHGVAQAQLLQSGILPNPALNVAILPLIAGVGTVTAWMVVLSQDTKALILYRSRRRAARASALQVDAEILWQEWLIAGQARQIAIELIEGDLARPTLQADYDLLDRRNRIIQQALAAGNATLVTAAPTLGALQSARTNLDLLDQNLLMRRHQLNALLGLVPDASVPLETTPTLPPFDAASIRAELEEMPDRRPDLLALRLGYLAQDQQVRTQILAQFPDLTLGPTANSDNSGVINGGPQGTIGLPIFDRNQGNVAIARATRDQLHEEYSMRLAATTGEVSARLLEIEQLSGQLAAARRDLPAARLAAERASSAFGASNLDERSYVELIVNRYVRELQVMTLEQGLLARQAAVLTLVGVGLPRVDSLPDTAGIARHVR